MDIRAQIVKTDSVYATSHLGFSQAIIATGFVFTSGQVGWGKQFQLTGKGNFEAQAIQSFKNLALLLEQSGSSMPQVIHLRIYVTSLSNVNKRIITQILKSYYPGDYQVATTLLCIKALARKELKIEIEAISTVNKIKE